MARPKQPFFSLQAHGTIGRVLTHRRDKRRTVAGIIPTHPDPATDLQEIHRARFQEANLWWNALSDAEKDVYRRLKYPPRMTGHQRAIRQWMIDNPYPPPPPPFGFQDNFDDNDLDLTRWQTTVTGDGLVAEQNQRLQTSGTINNTWAGILTIACYDLTTSITQAFQDIPLGANQYLFISPTEHVNINPQVANDFYMLFKRKDIGRCYGYRRLGGGGLVNLFDVPWLAQAGTLKYEIAAGQIELYEDAVLRASEPYQLPVYDCFIYLVSFFSLALPGLNWWDDFSLTD